MQIQRISIVSIPVSDPESSKRFYTEVLGFDVVRENPMGPEQRWIQLAPAKAEASITLVNWFEQMPSGCLQGIVLETDDVEADHRTLQQRGLEISDLREAPWGRYATFADPDGNGWVLQQTAPDA